MARKQTGNRRFGERLRAAREAVPLTQAELAAAVGVGQGDISSFETGSVMPTPQTLSAIADAVGETVDFLMGRTQMARELETLEALLMQSIGRKTARRIKAADESQLRALARDFAALAEARLNDPKSPSDPDTK